MEIIKTVYECEIHGLVDQVLVWDEKENYQCLECLDTILRSYYGEEKWRKKLYK